MARTNAVHSLAESDPVTWSTIWSDPQTTFNLILSVLTFFLVIGAFWQAHLSRSATRRQLRAYVLPSTITLIEHEGVVPAGILPQDRRPTVVINMRNSGQTPAYNMLHWAQLLLLPSSDENNLHVPDDLPQLSSTFLPSQGETSKVLRLDRPVSGPEIIEINSHQRALFVHGRVDYRDAFRRKRSVSYRLKYSGVYPLVGAVSLTYCDRGNNAD